MDDGLDVARSLLPGTELEVLGELGGSRRSVVRRLRAGGRTVIEKRFVEPGEWWARECAALSVLPAGVRAPRLIAAGPSTVLMTDLGPGRSVADLLLGDDAAAAADAVVRWATAIAALHRDTAGLRPAFREALALFDGTVAESRLDTDLEVAAAYFEEHYADETGGAELRALGVRLGGDGPAALTPSDACPDNNVLTAETSAKTSANKPAETSAETSAETPAEKPGEDGLALIDFEGAQWRHIAWDVAYLSVPWPTCWCAWRVPDDVLTRAKDAYRSAVGLPYASSPDFDADVAAASAAWTLMTATWLLPRASAEPRPARPGMPDLRAMIMCRLRGVRSQAALPGLAALAARVHDDLAARWGEIDLPYAPAFNGA